VKSGPSRQPEDRHAAEKKARDERLAAALRANLKRRKAAAREAADGDVAPPDKPGSSREEGG
jgi:hypothetical protein